MPEKQKVKQTRTRSEDQNGARGISLIEFGANNNNHSSDHY